MDYLSIIKRFIVSHLLIFHACTEAYIIEKRQTPTPCCLPYRFQAIVTPIKQFTPGNDQKILKVHRDWEQRIQVQDVIQFNTSGVSEPLQRTFMDFKNRVGYSVSQQQCQKFSINYGMLEPCMPDEAKYIGSSYLGLFDDKLHFQTWHFSRTTKNRSISMTISVTSDRCTPVMEHITGSLGAGETDTLVIFSNLTRDVVDEVFQIPEVCRESRNTSKRPIRSWTVDNDDENEDDNDNYEENDEISSVKKIKSTRAGSIDDDDEMWNRDIHG